MTLLVLNSGSTSVKFALFEDDAQTRLMTGSVSGIGAAPLLSLKAAGDKAERALDADATHEAAIAMALEEAGRLHDLGAIRAVAHRVVHGGTAFDGAIRLDEEVLAALEKLVPLAPLHQPFNLAGVAITQKALPHAAQVAAFDTAFHATQPRLARLYALPRRFIDQGIIRYGFHGLSYTHVAETLRRDDPVAAGGRVVAAHLGGGASLCAMREGASVAATMGFTALDGVPMGTRVGDLDPGAVLYMQTALGFSAAEVDDILNKQSGLLGVSGISGDMRTLLASDDPHAVEAVGLFVHRVVREIGSLAAALGGLDTLVFTGGIGEHAPEIRARVIADCAWLGVTMDAAANAANAARIDAGGPVSVRVIAADEEIVLARAAREILTTTGGL